MLVLLDEKCDKTNTEVKMRPGKIQACTGFASMTPAIPTGSWSLCWFQMNL